MTYDASDLLRRITRLHTAVQLRAASCCGIQSLTRCQLLTTLSREGSLTLADLARHLEADKGWLSRNVDDLVQDGLVNKQPHPVDRRSITLTLTLEGQRQVQALNTELCSQSARLLSRIPPEEREGVLRALEVLAEALGAEYALQHGLSCNAT